MWCPDSTSLKYSKPSEASGSRLVLVCDVALGRCLEVRKKHLRLTQPPDTYHSLHGLRHTPANHSQFVVRCVCAGMRACVCNGHL